MALKNILAMGLTLFSLAAYSCGNDNSNNQNNQYCGSDMDCGNYQICSLSGQCIQEGTCAVDKDCGGSLVCENYICKSTIEKFNTPYATIDGLIRYAKAGDLEKVRLCFDSSASDAKQLTMAKIQNIAEVLGNSEMQQSTNLGPDSVQQEYKTPTEEEFPIILYHENDGWKIHDL